MSLRPKVALLLGTASTWAPAATLSATRSSKAISQQIAIPSRTPAASTAPAPGAGHEVAGPVGVVRQQPEERPPRQVLAEGLHPPLVGAVDDSDPGLPRPAPSWSRCVPSVRAADQDRAQHDRHPDGARGPVDRRGGVGVAQRVDVGGVLRPQHHVRARAASPAATSAASCSVTRTWLSSTARRCALKSRPSRGTLPCTAAIVTVRTGEPSRRAAAARPAGPPRARRARAARARRRPAPPDGPGAAPASPSASPASTVANDSSGAPPTAATGSSGPSGWPNATRPHGNPPNGRPRPQRLRPRPTPRPPTAARRAAATPRPSRRPRPRRTPPRRPRAPATAPGRRRCRSSAAAAGRSPARTARPARIRRGRTARARPRRAARTRAARATTACAARTPVEQHPAAGRGRGAGEEGHEGPPGPPRPPPDAADAAGSAIGAATGRAYVPSASGYGRAPGRSERGVRCTERTQRRVRWTCAVRSGQTATRWALPRRSSTPGAPVRRYHS